MARPGWVYITTNKKNGVLYTGVTSGLKTRILQHKDKQFKTSFSAQYNLDKLVYYADFSSITLAIAREKQIKAGSRKKKIALIEGMNPEWLDLFDTLPYLM